MIIHSIEYTNSLYRRDLYFAISKNVRECFIDLPDGQPLGTSSTGRKVRSPQGSMPANGRGGPLKAGFTESATENVPPRQRGKGEKVR